MVAITLAKEQLWRLHRVCITQNRGWPCKEELVQDHTDRNQHANQSNTDHKHGGRVGGVYANHAAAKLIGVAELENDPKDKEEDKHELDYAAERVIAPLAERLELLLQKQVKKCNHLTCQEPKELAIAAEVDEEHKVSQRL